LKQIEDFEKTIKDLEINVGTLKARLTDNRSKFGDDISKWPKE